VIACLSAEMLADSGRWYGYEPIPALPGVWKCAGFQDSANHWDDSEEMRARFPTLLVVLGYRGDRITLTTDGTREVSQADVEQMQRQRQAEG
jgi:hypothetical protein